jgi:hypothetical protein
MSMTINALIVFFHHFAENVPAMLITAAAAVLMACALGCSCSPCRAKDRLFNREVY